MATTIAVYDFDDATMFESAKSRIYDEVGSPYSHGWWTTDSYYRIGIDDTCDKVTLIGQICRAHGGVPGN